MRFVRFKRGGAQGVGVKVGNVIKGYVRTDSRFAGDLDKFVAIGNEGLAAFANYLSLGDTFDEGEIEFLPVLANPGKIICVGLNYSDHTAESGYKQPDHPTFFARFTSSLIGHNARIIDPAVSHSLDFEGELAVIIGKRGRAIKKQDVAAHVLGYSIFNDASIREFQHRTPQWTLGKNFDATGAFGPYLVTAEEIPPLGRGLAIETRLNGQVVQKSNTDHLIFDIETLISELSVAMTLEPGDVIITGTPSGVGHARDPKLYMKPGDICEVEIERLGILSNAVA